MIKTCLLAASLALLPGAALAHDASDSPSHASALGEFEGEVLAQEIEAILEKHEVPGAHVTLTHGAAILYARGFGIDPSANEARFSASTPNRLASATKVLTSLTVLSLIEEGVIDLDSTLGEIDPTLPDHFRPLPVWRVLNHTSGIPMIVNREEFHAMPREEMLAMDAKTLLGFIDRGELDFAPGEGWHYQQSAYALLAEGLAKMTGTDWQTLVRTHVLEPAGMVSTRFTQPGDIAPAYVMEDGVREYFDFAGPALLAPGGGYDTDAQDMARLLVALSQGTIVSADTLAMAMDPARLHRQSRNVEGEGYGPGLIVQQFGDRRLVGHSGGGGLADIRYAPGAQLGIAVLTNRAGGTGVASEIADLLSERYLGPAKRTPAD